MDKELRSFTVQATRLAASLRESGAGGDLAEAADLLDRAVGIAGDFEAHVDATDSVLAVADGLLEESVQFSLPIVNGLDGRKSRLTAAQRKYADARGFNMVYPDGRSIW